ncbi:15356_t:CDS:2 [Rhizophagus irregularis]|nr:15356_t:CDS:2 [Rhizophagus irregularis]
MKCTVELAEVISSMRKDFIKTTEEAEAKIQTENSTLATS